MNELLTPAEAKKTTLALRIPERDLAALEDLAGECAALATMDLTPFRRTFLVAAGMQKLRDLITPGMMTDVMALQGSALGFKTDRDDKGGYDMTVVKDVAIEATLRGLRLVGNEINIIAGRMYAAKDGLRRLVQEWPGLTDLRLEIWTPRSREGQTVVPCKAGWLLHGKPQAIDCTGETAIPVRVNREQIVDAIIGKATRKLYARIYDVLTGQAQGLVEADEEAVAATSQEVLPPAAAGPSEDEHQDQERRLAKYRIDLGICATPAHVAAIMRRAAQDGDLWAESKKRVSDLGNERLAEIRNTTRGAMP